MVFPVIAIVILPALMLIVAAPPFDEPINVQPSEGPPESAEGMYIVFFILWIIWILILARTALKVRNGSFKIKNRF